MNATHLVESPIDFRAEQSYRATQTPSTVQIPVMRFVLVDGTSGPEAVNTDDGPFQEARQILSGIVYTMRYWANTHERAAGFAPFSLAPMETLWWTPDADSLDEDDEALWHWTAMLRVPEFVTEAYFSDVVNACVASKGNEVYRRARLEDFDEGLCVQVLHVGPYSSEGPTIQALHRYAAEQGFRLTGKHHELYFGDPRRSAPEKLRTILRQPIANR